jgi:hypothetical protein
MRKRNFEIDAKYYQVSQKWQVTFFRYPHRGGGRLRGGDRWRKSHPNLATAAAMAALWAVQDIKRGEAGG